MKILGLDIPTGLELLFENIFKPLVLGSTDVLTTKKTPVSYKQKGVLVSKSLMHRWGGLYDSFDSTRRDAWQSYWTSLPFGSHGGANGWPGSGFSAFIYVNAPRFKLGEDLLYDPPVSTGELIVDGNFALGNFDNWGAVSNHRNWSIVSGKAQHAGGASDVLQYDNAQYWDGAHFAHSGPGSGIWGGPSFGSRRLANRYTPTSSHDVKVVALQVGPSGAVSDDLYVRLYHGGSTPATGTLIATSDHVPDPQANTSQILMYFTFPSAVSLTAGEDYFFVIDRDGGNYDTDGYWYKTYIQYVTGSPPYIASFWNTTGTSLTTWSESNNTAIIMRLGDGDFDSTPIAQFFGVAEHADYKFSCAIGGTTGQVQIQINGTLIGTVDAGSGTFTYYIPDGDGDFRLLAYIEDFAPNDLEFHPSFDFDGTIDNVSLAQTSDSPVVPALSTELVSNGDFSGNADGWDLEGWSYRDHSIAVDDAGLEGGAFHKLPTARNWQAGTFNVQFDIGAGGGGVYFLIYNSETSDIAYERDGFAGDGHVDETFAYDFVATGDIDSWEVYIFTDEQDVEISAVSIQRVA